MARGLIMLVLMTTAVLLAIGHEHSVEEYPVCGN